MTAKQMTHDRYLSPKQVREDYLPAFSRSGLYRLLQLGDIHGARVGKKWLISEASVLSFMDQLSRSV